MEYPSIPITSHAAALNLKMMLQFCKQRKFNTSEFDEYANKAVEKYQTLEQKFEYDRMVEKEAPRPQQGFQPRPLALSK